MARLLPTMIAAQMMTAMLVVVSVLVVGSLAAGTCFDANNQEFVYDAQRNTNMETCCWYSSSSCCFGDEGTRVLHDTAEYFERYIDNLRKRPNRPLVVSHEKCFNYFADFWCLSCSGDTGDYVHTVRRHVEIDICRSWCNRFYSACNGIEHYFHKNITNSRELCNWIGSQWSGATFNIVDDSAPNHKTCFTGVGAEVIGASECQPFDFSKSLAPPPPPGRAPPPGTKKDTGGFPTGAIVGLAIGGSIVGCLGIVGIVGCIVGGVMLYRKRKAEGGAQYQSTLESGEAILGTGNGDDDEDEEDQEDDEL